MAFKTVYTDQAPAAVGPYSQAIDTGSLVFVSGQVGLDPATGQLAGDDFESQARQALSNMTAVLAAAGCTVNDVAAVDVFLVDMGNFAQFNGFYEEAFGDHRPARAAIAVRALPLNAQVEVKCIAQRQ